MLTRGGHLVWGAHENVGRDERACFRRCCEGVKGGAGAVCWMLSDDAEIHVTMFRGGATHNAAKGDDFFSTKIFNQGCKHPSQMLMRIRRPVGQRESVEIDEVRHGDGFAEFTVLGSLNQAVIRVAISFHREALLVRESASSCIVRCQNCLQGHARDDLIEQGQLLIALHFHTQLPSRVMQQMGCGQAGAVQPLRADSSPFK